MSMNHDPMASSSVFLAAAVLAISVSAGTPATAGMTDTETGEQCWETGCFDSGDQAMPGGSGSNDPVSSGPTLLANLTIEDCTDSTAQRVSDSVAWLQNNLPAIDATMQQSNILMFWPGNTRENFGDKLHKDLKFACIDGKNKCAELWGRTVPVLHQKRVALCSDTINQSAGYLTPRMDQLYVHVIAHEIGHLIRLNGHDSNCGFSDSLGFAAEYAFMGVPYEPATTGPCSSPPPFSLEDKLNSGNMEQPLQVLK